jgi:4-amino-4-deoxy-L-arabinose transferase-like glycosyltransferase
MVSKLLKIDKFLILILVLAFATRFVNLGYSDFQGDEIKALFRPTEDQTTLDFLLTQRKGPVQFLVTYLLKLVDPTYDNYYLVRFPFAVAGFLAVYFFYRLVEHHFGKKVAFYASFFFATNGFLIAFSRIVQYQSFVILFMVLALLMFSRKHIFWGFIFWAISILSHYDGIFIAPFALYLIYMWFKDNKTQVKKLVVSAVSAVALTSAFYIPFIMSITAKTRDYWLGRVTGDVSSKISSSVYLFKVYQPIYVLQIYLILFVLGLALLAFLLTKPSFPKVKLLQKISIPLKIPLAPSVFVLFWFLPAFIFLEALVYIPGTHIYTYIIPALIIIAFGVLALEIAIKKLVGLIKLKFLANYLTVLGIAVVFAFISAQSYLVFVDHSIEYPWENKPFLFWTLPKPTPIYHLSIFGFPYNRNWRGIREFASSRPEITAYTTNERSSIARYHIPLEKDSTKAGFYVYIRNPQSFTNEIVHSKPAYWVENNDPDYIYIKDGKEFSKVYLMTPGELPGAGEAVN